MNAFSRIRTFAGHVLSRRKVARTGTFALAGLVLATGSTLIAPDTAAAEEVNVYSYRQPFLIKPMFEAFEKETGIKVNVVFAKKGLIERLKSEGQNSPADVLLAVDIGRLNDAVEAGVTQPLSSDVVNANIPANMRHPEGRWIGLTKRARILYVSKDRVKPGEIQTYEDLVDPKWKGRICTRSGKHVYNVALYASMISIHGEAKAEEWLKGLKANLARKPQGNDRAQVKAISEGECDIAIGNHYYYGKMLDKDDQKAWAEAVNLVFPNQGDRGTHVNLSGAVVTASAPNHDNAIKLVEFLSGDTAQKLYAEKNSEYPVKPGVPWSDRVKSWGTFKSDDVSLANLAKLRPAAIKMVDRVGFND